LLQYAFKISFDGVHEPGRALFEVGLMVLRRVEDQAGKVVRGRSAPMHRSRHQVGVSDIDA